MENISRTERYISQDEGATVKILSYKYRENAALVEKFDRVALMYLLDSRAVPLPFAMAGSFYQPGKLYLAPPNQNLVGRSTTAPQALDVLSCEFSPTWIEETSDISLDWKNVDPDAVTSFSNAYINYSLKKIAEIVRSPSAGANRLLTAISNSVAIELACHFGQCRPLPKITGRLAGPQLHRIDEWLNDTDQRIPDIATMAGEFGISPGHLRRLFRNAVGESLQDRIHEARMRRAKDLLADQSRPLKIVAYLLGYSHHSTFTAAFQQHYGISPSSYRRKTGDAQTAVADMFRGKPPTGIHSS